MTGTPIVYPSDVGSDTTKIFIGDADGTVWRFDVSSSDPTQWIGELYLDLYNNTVDTSSTSWGDGQPLEVTPVVSLDTSGELVMNIATGTTEAYDNSGLEYVYSVTEKVQGTTPKLRASVNWWIAPPTFQPGERVSGPMTVFNGTLYFSTYAAAAAGSQVCSGGLARLWGRDFVTPDNTAGPVAGWPAGDAAPAAQPAADRRRPSSSNRATTTRRCWARSSPGSRSRPSPACASLGLGQSDPYVAGGTHQHARQTSRPAATRSSRRSEPSRQRWRNRRPDVRDERADSRVADGHRLMGGCARLMRWVGPALPVPGDGLVAPILVGRASRRFGCGRTRVERGARQDRGRPGAGKRCIARAAMRLTSSPPESSSRDGRRPLASRSRATSVVDGAFTDVVYASGPVGVHPLVEYFRAHVTDGSLREGPEAATFEHVHAPGASRDGAPRSASSFTAAESRVDLRDTTPKAAPVLPDESARWRQVGLTPNGRLADPTHLD